MISIKKFDSNSLKIDKKSYKDIGIYNMGEVKQINITNGSYYFYNEIIDLENFAARLLKIDKKSFKAIDIY